MAVTFPASRQQAAGQQRWCPGIMDIEQLIAEVSFTPAIWDSSHTKHSDRTFIARQWRRIGDKLGVAGEFSCTHLSVHRRVR